jgi:hypothetical protein
LPHNMIYHNSALMIIPKLFLWSFLLADKTNMILWTYLSGEVLTDIRALADYFS